MDRDLDRDYFMTAEEARAYGLIDDIIVPRRGLASPLPEMAAAGLSNTLGRRAAALDIRIGRRVFMHRRLL